MRSPAASVIVPNYNHAQFLEERLKSIFSQSFQDFEVILLDDASTDNSLDVLKKYAARPRVSHLIINKENSGSTFKQWDRGISLAKGEFVWIAETDDYCDNDFLDKLITAHRLQPDISLAFCQSHKVNNKGEVTGNWLTHTNGFNSNPFIEDFTMKGNQFIENFLIHKNVIPNVSAVVFKKADLKGIQPLIFEPYMKYNADWYYYIQLLCNKKVFYLSQSLNYFRYHPKSVIGQARKEKKLWKIYRMELRGRKNMLSHITSQNLPNHQKIRKEYRKGNLRLKRMIIKEFKKEITAKIFPETFRIGLKKTLHFLRRH